METTDIDKKLISFIQAKIGKDVTSQTELFSDLNLIGLDADVFIEDLASEFEVDFSTFVFRNYFDEVYSIPFSYLFMKKIFPRHLKKKTFLLEHLVNVVKRKKWFDPPLSVE